MPQSLLLHLRRLRPRLVILLPLLLFGLWFWAASLFSSPPSPMASSDSNSTSSIPPLPVIPPPKVDEELVYESLPCIRIYKSGLVERYFGSEFTPASTDPATGVTSKDVVIDPRIKVGARIYLPKITDPSKKIPILVYYHGGGFCLGSAYNPTFHNYFNGFVALSNVLVVSVEYRLAPEHPVPAQYEDSWLALDWVVSHADGAGQEPWISKHADFDRLYLGGESAGANIAHHMAMKVGLSGIGIPVKINGLAMIHPYFLGSNKVESDSIDPAASESLASLWKVVSPNTTGIDDPWINPFVASAPKLDALACDRVLVCVAGKDALRDRGKLYYNKLKESGWNGELVLNEVPGVGHTFHLLSATSDAAVAQDRTISAFLNH
ncbi:2-hydroxyisoflavanone dehydratase-like [Carex rostrata]